jgi:zinc protease
MGMIQKHYGDWERGYVEPRVKPEPEQKREKKIKVPYEGQSLPILWLAYKTDAFDPQNRIRVAADLLAELAFGETSDIHKKLVLDEQVVEFLSADVNLNRDPGLMDILTRVKKEDKVDYVREEIDKVIARYQENPPDEKRLADLKARLKYGFLMGLDTPDRVASSLARVIAVTGGVEAIDEWYTTIESLTPGEVQEAAKKYLNRNRRTVAVLRGNQ